MNVVWYRLRVSESQRHTPIKIFPSTPRVGEVLTDLANTFLLRETRLGSGLQNTPFNILLSVFFLIKLL